MYAGALLPGTIDPAEYRTAFAGMRCLTTLRLIAISDFVVLLPALSLAPVLTRLEVTFHSLDVAVGLSDWSALLRANPRLTVVLTSSKPICSLMRVSLRSLLESEADRLLIRVSGQVE